MHLRSNVIYMLGQLKSPDHPDEVNSQYCWCNVTQHVIGPDQEHVIRVACIPPRLLPRQLLTPAPRGEPKVSASGFCPHDI